MLMSPDLRAPNYHRRKLVSQYFAQRLPNEHYSAMAECSAVTYRPGGYTSSFKDRTLLPAGVAVRFSLQYDSSRSSRDRPSVQIPVYGQVGNVRPSGIVAYDDFEPRLQLDLARRPRAGVGGRVFDPERNPSLLDTALRMDKACQRAVEIGWPLPSEPLSPRIMLEFAPSRLPAFQDTPALRERAARSLGVPIQQVGANGPVLLERLLRDVWLQSFVYRLDPAGRTGPAMVDAQLCPGASGFLRAYEDFSQVLGVATWNASRELRPELYPNPALAVLQEIGLGPSPDFNADISQDLIAAMLGKIRECLGALNPRFSDEDLLDAVTGYSQPLVAWSTELPRLRARLPVWAQQCCEDEDLRRAVLNPDEPLWIRHACRIQVYRRQVDAVSRSAEQQVTRSSGRLLNRTEPWERIAG